MADQGGLFGMDPSLLMNLGIGLMSSGAKNSPLRGNAGLGLAQGLQGYYGQREANQAYQMNAQKMQMERLQMQMAMQKFKALGDLVNPEGAQGAPQSNQPPAGLMGGAQPQGSPQPGPIPPGPSAAGPQPPSLPSWLTPPTQASINQTPIGGMNPNALLRYNMIGLNKDPLTATKEIHDQQLELQKQQVQPVLGKLDTLVKSDSPAKYMQADPELSSAWPVLAQKLGLDPKNDLNDQGVRNAFTFQRNAISSALGMQIEAPNVQEQTIRLPDGRIAQVDPVSKKMTINSAGPDVISAEDRFKNALDMQKFEMSKIPNGYEKDPDNPGSIRFIPGGPADPMSQAGGLGARNEVMFQRVASSAQAATRAMRNIAELPITASSGWLGGYQPSSGLLGATKAVLAGKVTSQEAQDYQTMLAGISRNLATVETAGLAPGGALTHSMDALTLKEGDSQMTKLRKMAEMRQIIEENLPSQLANPKLPPSQKELIKGIIQSAQEAVPFTQEDITKLQQSKNPKQTIMDFAKSQGLNTNSAAPSRAAAGAAAPSIPPTNAKGWQLHQDAKGNYAYVAPNGRDFEPVK